MPGDAMKLTQINVYPVKSMAGISVSAWPLDAMGLQWDRRWMVVDAEGCFFTQRSRPELALIRPRLGPTSLTLSHAGMPDLPLPLQPQGPLLSVRVWQDRVAAVHVKAADVWLRRVLQQPCRLVHLPENEVRPLDPAYAHAGDRTGFADGFPLLLASAASLAALNGCLSDAVQMARFRPNLVVSGAPPWAEDDWRRLCIGRQTMRVVKPCGRCRMITVNPVNGRFEGPEPLATLAGFRRQGGEVVFGQNLIHDGPGPLQVGNDVEIME